MSGHSKWSKIKRGKAVQDEKRSKAFSKLLRAVSVAARNGANPESNVELKRAIEEAKKANVPKENIERAIRKEEAGSAEELIVGAYGPESSAILVVCRTDNKNRTIQEIKSILNDNGGKWSDIGSVMWAFEKEGDSWRAKFTQRISDEAKEELDKLITALKGHNDVEEVYTNSEQ